MTENNIFVKTQKHSLDGGEERVDLDLVEVYDQIINILSSLEEIKQRIGRLERRQR